MASLPQHQHHQIHENKYKGEDERDSSSQRLEFQLPKGELGLQLTPFQKDLGEMTDQGIQSQDNEHQQQNQQRSGPGKVKGKGKGGGIGCLIKGWNNVQNLPINLPIGSKIILLDGDYVETMPFHEIVKRLKASEERILVVEIRHNKKQNEDDAQNGRKREQEDEQDEINRLNRDGILSQEIHNVINDDDHDDDEEENEEEPSGEDEDEDEDYPQSSYNNRISTLPTIDSSPPTSSLSSSSSVVDGKLLLLQSQLTTSKQQQMKLEKIIESQSLELEKQQQDINNLKSQQRDSDGQRMLLKYQLDKSSQGQLILTQQLQLQHQQNENQLTVVKDEKRVISREEGEEEMNIKKDFEFDRFSFLLHSNKFKLLMKQLRRRFNTHLLPPEEIDGISAASKDPSRPIQRPLKSSFSSSSVPVPVSVSVPASLSTTAPASSSHTPIETRRRPQEGTSFPNSRLKEAEVFSNDHSKSNYRQDEFSDYIRSKIGLNQTEELFATQTKETNINERFQPIPAKTSLNQHTSSSHSRENPPPPLQPPQRSQQQAAQQQRLRSSQVHSNLLRNPPTAVSGLSSQPATASLQDSSKNHSKFQMESLLIHEEVKRFRNFMDEMRAECSLSPAPVFSSSGYVLNTAPPSHRHRQQGHPPSHRPLDQSTERSSIKSSQWNSTYPHSSISTSTSRAKAGLSASSSRAHNNSRWKSSLNSSVGLGDEILEESFLTKLNPETMNFNHLGKIATSPPPPFSHSSHYTSTPQFNYTS